MKRYVLFSLMILGTHSANAVNGAHSAKAADGTTVDRAAKGKTADRPADAPHTATDGMRIKRDKTTGGSSAKPSDLPEVDSLRTYLKENSAKIFSGDSWGLVNAFKAESVVQNIQANLDPSVGGGIRILAREIKSACEAMFNKENKSFKASENQMNEVVKRAVENLKNEQPSVLTEEARDMPTDKLIELLKVCLL